MAQGRSTKIVSMIKWIRTSRLTIKNFLSDAAGVQGFLVKMVVSMHVSLKAFDSPMKTTFKVATPERGRQGEREGEIERVRERERGGGRE